jgi:ribosome biogenesis SPOUT family RNA methylase Rps3
VRYRLTNRYAHMLNLIGPSSQLHFTSLSSSSIPPLQKYLEDTTPSSSSKAHLHTDPILTLVEKLGSTSARVCLLDPRAPKELAPEDGETFDIFLYGGILGELIRLGFKRCTDAVGDDPPRDRTGELRKLGFEGRHLKEVQMTTDTAVGVSKRVVEDKGELKFTFWTYS